MGEGFTEWAAVKQANPLFPGHYQPRVPAHSNYYNLLDKNTMKWQDININYCFSWANQSWIASWSKLKKSNVWLDTAARRFTDDNGMLLEQKYGTHEEWKRHFEYLLLQLGFLFLPHTVSERDSKIIDSAFVPYRDTHQTDKAVTVKIIRTVMCRMVEKF